MKKGKLNGWKYLLLTAVTLFCLGLGVACSKEIKLTFETNGGTPVAEIVTEAGADATLPSPTRSGYAFDGWYTDADFSGERLEGKISAPDKSTKYYAKWATGYEVKFDPDGGTLTSSSLWLKEGANVYDAVKDIAPDKSGLTFGAWFLNGAELSRSFRMPAETVILTARYKVGYIIQIYQQNLSRTSYQRNDALETEGSGYVNAEETPAPPAVEGYSVQPDPVLEGKSPVSTLVLKENAEENVFSLYYDRNDYPIVYNAAAPAGVEAEGTMSYEIVIYGGTAPAAECGFSAEGYRFAGWALSPDGEIAYLPKEEVKVSGPVNLYAVWDRGYVDRYGSDDLVFFPRTEPSKAVLSRNGMEFEGVRNGDGFTFESPAEETLSGVVIGGFFCYERPDVAGDYIFHDNYPRPAEEGDVDEADRYDATRTLSVDKYLGAVYTEQGKKVNGSLVFERSQGDYLFTSDDGQTSFHALFQKGSGADRRDIFSVGGEEFGYYVDVNGEVLVLDGYGTAFLNITLSSGSQTSLQGYYYIEGRGLAFNTMKSYKVVCWINDSSDVLGGGRGWRTFYLCALPDYWEEYDADYGLYYFADNTRGIYENGNAKLELDGHGYYLDSAKYTDGQGNEQIGGYSVRTDFVSGSVIEMVQIDDKGESHTVNKFKLFEDGTFTLWNDPEVGYTEYYLMEGTALQPVLLAIFEEPYQDIAGSKRAEMYARNSRNVAVHAASGYVTSKPAAEGASLLIYDFTRVEAEYGFEQSMPGTMTFTLTRVQLQSGSSTWYNAYCVLTRNGVQGYDVIKLPHGYVWASKTVTSDGEGSLYFTGNNVYRCSFPVERDEYFGDLYGELLYSVTETATEGLNELFKLTPADEEGFVYEAEPAAGLPTTFYYFDPDLSPENGPFENLVLTPDGRASYDEKSDGSWKTGTFRAVEGKSSHFGTQVYALAFGGGTEFEFVQGNLYFLGVSYTAYFRYVGKEGTYSAGDGGTLLLDGYGSARYYPVTGSSLTGSYYFMTDNILRLSAADGTQREFELSADETFTALDDCYGSWDLLNGNFFPINEHSKIDFDGKGTYTIRPQYGSGEPASGHYELTDPETQEYILYGATIDGVGGNYYVRFMEYVEYANYNCIVRDRASGIYVDEHNNVLSLNGFGSGFLKGNVYSTAGNFRLIDADYGFGYMQFTTENTAYYEQLCHFLLDYENGTFRILEETGYYDDIVYFASDLDHIAFRSDGAAFIGNLINGDYFIDEEKEKIIVYEESGPSYIKHELPLYGKETYVYGEKTYYRFEGTTFTAAGKLSMLDEGGKSRAEVDATFTFEMRPRSIVAFDASFTIGGESYGGFLLYTYTTGAIDPRIEYDNIVYNIDFTRGEDGKWTFTVPDAGVRVFERQDYTDKFYEGAEVTGGKVYAGGSLSVVYDGLGGYRYLGKEPAYNGKFYYLYNAEAEDLGLISFENLPASSVRTVGYHDLGDDFGGYRSLKEIVFTAGEKQYAIDFFEYSTGSFASVMTHSYLLYGFSEYEEKEAGAYRVGVKYLLYTNLLGSPGYGDRTAIGTPVAATLLGEGGAPVVALVSGVRYDDKGIWLVENNGGRPGAAYLIDFTKEEGKVTSCSVTKGAIQTVGLTSTYYFYLFIDDDGEIGEIMAAWYAGTLFTSVEKVEHTENVWTFLGREGADEPLRTYTLTFTKGGSGNYSVTVDSEIVKDPAD